MIVDSKTLLGAAETIQRSNREAMSLSNGVTVSAAQLKTAARILQEAEPSIITSASGPARVTLNEPQERPGYIENDRQDGPEVLTFSVGIIPSTTYRIARDGTVQ